MNNANKIRNRRYEVIIKELIVETISKEIYDEYIKMATIIDVDLTNDKSIAKVYIDCYNKSNIDKILTKINGASGFFRTVLAKELNWRKAPKVIFVKDTTSDKYDEIESIIRGWKENKNG